jgi:hypothetical protein
MSYISGAPCEARNFNVVYIRTYVWQRWKPTLSICCTMFQHWSCTMFQHWINAESSPVPQLCVNTLPATNITLITDWIQLGSLRVNSAAGERAVASLTFQSLLITWCTNNFKIQQLCALPTLYLCVFQLSENESDLCRLNHKLTGFYSRD